MANQDIGFFMEHQADFDALTEDQLASLARGESIEHGDTEAATATETEDAPAPGTESVTTEEADSPVLLARDGKNVIPFQELLDARAKASQWEAFAAEQSALVESLKQAKIEDEKTGTTDAQEAVMAEYQGEFPEVATDMKPFIQAMIDAGVKASMSALEAKFAPLQQAAASQVTDAHFAAIRAAVPDIDTLLESNAVTNWIKTQPSFMQPAANKVMESGTAAEVIELFASFKAATQTGSPAASTKGEIQKQAAAVIAKAQTKTPTSLTDIPSGTIAVTDEVAAMNSMSASQLLSKFEGKSPTEILKLMQRVS